MFTSVLLFLTTEETLTHRNPFCIQRFFIKFPLTSLFVIFYVAQNKSKRKHFHFKLIAIRTPTMRKHTFCEFLKVILLTVTT